MRRSADAGISHGVGVGGAGRRRGARDAKLAAVLAKKGVQILHVGSDVLAAVSYQTKLVAEIKAG